MALEEYRKMRDVRKTPELAKNRRRRKAAAATLAFVVQKHAARRLHYDFRLELGGVMKSWAVPRLALKRSAPSDRADVPRRIAHRPRRVAPFRTRRLPASSR
ncbi:MAG TPA: DNA polymerase ligase N-terminal domain-containing protein [Stellaceae bacterium]|nr:DNA polymerase ligase N-terminal domain-containing protein [Stellaceae bacterium]